MEELLNKLIEKGWNVFPDKKFFWNKDKLRFSKWKKCVWFWNDDYTLRMLVSKESWLWQFVCENGMVKKNWNSEWVIIYPDEWSGEYQNCHSYSQWNKEFRIIQSALTDEDKLEDFILSNIKLD